MTIEPLETDENGKWFLLHKATKGTEVQRALAKCFHSPRWITPFPGLLIGGKHELRVLGLRHHPPELNTSILEPQKQRRTQATSRTGNQCNPPIIRNRAYGEQHVLSTAKTAPTTSAVTPLTERPTEHTS
jgi:hypothetical protein